jgi:hypothetical protein
VNSDFVSSSVPYHQRLTFVWLAAGPHGEPEAAFVIDGRDYADAEQARAAVREALDQTELRAQIADFQSGDIAYNEHELAHWPSWEEFRRALDVYGPVDPSPGSASEPAAPMWTPPAPAPAPAPARTGVAQTPLYSERHFECWGELVEIFPPGQGPHDPILDRRVEGYGLNGYTGEFEPDTRRALQCAHGMEDDDTWPLRDEDEFIAAVEERREKLLRSSFYQRHDKPEIFAAYEQAARAGRTAQSRRATYELWRAANRRRAFFLVGTEHELEPVRVDLADDGAPVTAWRLDPASGRIVATGRDDAEAVFSSVGGRVTEYVWLLAVEERRRTLAVPGGAIAEAYAKADAMTDAVYRRRILTRSFDLWAERFAVEGDA